MLSDGGRLGGLLVKESVGLFYFSCLKGVMVDVGWAKEIRVWNTLE